MTEDKFNRKDDFEMDLSKWKLMQQSKNTQADEEKRLYKSKTTKEDFKNFSNQPHTTETLNELLVKYPNKFYVAWQWREHRHNKKLLFCPNKAQRLFDCITIDGNQLVA